MTLCSAVREYIGTHVSPLLEADRADHAATDSANPNAEERIVRLENYRGAFQVDPAFIQSRMQGILDQLAKHSA